MMNTPARDDLVGRLIGGRYRVDRLIAEGGMAAVYLATDERLDRPVAVKVLAAQFARDPDFLQRFTLEARNTARMSHPHVVAVHDQGIDGDVVYLVLEYVDGYTLRDLLARRGAMPPGLALAILDPVLEALAAAHEAGYAHRDIKPENVLIGPRGVIKVADFGLARALHETSAQTQQGLVIGTAAYVAPEHVSGQPTDARTDVYGAGILLFEMLTGRPPYSGESALSVAYQHVNDEVPRPSHRIGGIPTEVDELVEASTRREPGERYSGAEEFLTAVRQVRVMLPPAAALPATLTPLATATAVLQVPAGDDTVEQRVAPPVPPAPAAMADAPPPRGRRRPVPRVLIMTLLALMAVGVGWAFAAGPLQRVDVPVLDGLTVKQATTAAAEAGLTIGVVEREFSETVAKGIVIRSDPAAGGSTFTGRPLGLVVSRGPERYDVPAVRGKTPDGAAEAITAANLRVDTQDEAFNDKVDEGLVIRTEPPAGTPVKRDTPVDLIVSKGPAPVPVPDVVGLQFGRAETVLTDAGLRVDKRGEEYSDAVPDGAVLSVQPAVGTVVERGSTVGVVVSKGPPPVLVPDVVDMRRGEAVAALEAAGFQVSIQEGIVTPLDRVYSQDPDGGTTAPRGSTVTIQVF